MTENEKEKQITWKVVNPLSRERIEEHRKRLGMKLRPTGSYRGIYQWALWDRICTFVDKIGDPNPLWRNEAYARKTRYGHLPAPPSFIACTVGGPIIQGLPGVQIMVGGAAFEFYKPPLDGDQITYEAIFADLEEKASAFSTLWLIEYYDCFYYNQRSELLAKARYHMLRWERREIDEGLMRTDKARKTTMPHPWTEDEIRQFEDEMLAQIDNIRGSTPRYWEDVNVGETLPDLVRGPRRYTDGIAEGSIPIVRSGVLGIREMRRHPGYALWHPDSRAYEKIELIHWDKILAKHLHYAHAYDYGTMRQAIAMNAITDWMGDDGWLKKHSAQVRRVVYKSDVLRIKSKVTKKYMDENGEYCVDIEQHTTNQRGDDVLPAQVTVALPSRDKGTWPVSTRVPH
jgi:acyl dehydratase